MLKTGILEYHLKNRILVLDGAMGTMLQKCDLKNHDLNAGGCCNHFAGNDSINEILCLTKPGIISDIHKQYLEAGADIIETNTFNATSVVFKEYNIQKYTYEVNLAAAEIARKAAGEYTRLNPLKPRFVAGSIGPTNKSLSLSTDVENPASRNVSFDELSEAYYEQALALSEGQVDMLLVETIFDTLNAKAAVSGILRSFEKTNIYLPVILSVTINGESGRTLSGQTLEAFLISVSHANPLAVGVNCSFGAKQMLPFIESLSEVSPYYSIAYPNAGLPDEQGKYSQEPGEMLEIIKEILDKKLVNIIGGCCGTTPAHIKSIADVCGNYSPKIPVENAHITRVSGLEPLNISKSENFINVGERTNVAGSRQFARLIKEKKYDEAVAVARKQVEAGAQIIDISMDDSMLDAENEMETFLKILASEPEVSRVPFMIDSSKWEIIETAIKCIQGKPVVNSISLKEGEPAFISKAEKILKLGAAVVVMTFDEKGQAVKYEEKIHICQRAYKLLLNIGFPPEDIIFDPNIMTIGTGLKEHGNYALDYLRAVRWIKENLKYAKVSGGVSNLSFAFRGNNKLRESLHSVFLFHAIQAGMDMGIVNAGALPVYNDIKPELVKLCEDLIFNSNDNATDNLLKYAVNYITDDNRTSENIVDKRAGMNFSEKLYYAMINGSDEFLEQDINESLQSGESAINIVEGPLMKGMNEVGRLFGDGKLFLPQVLRSSRIMKKAVAALTPALQKENAGTGNNGCILLATVKGDTHDIGKNIVSVVLSCNSFKVVDLGVMIPAAEIVGNAINVNADIIGLSGLISPSLDEMINVAKEMQRHNLSIPLLIGGATTSLIHTALKIAPEYSGPVVHVKDASLAPGIAFKLLSGNRSDFIDELNKKYTQIRESEVPPVNKIQYVTIADARDNVLNIDDYEIYGKETAGVIQISENVNDLLPFINWKALLRTYRMKTTYEEILNERSERKYNDEAGKLLNDAKKLFDEIVLCNVIKPAGLYGFFPAYANGDDIDIYSNNSGTEIIETLCFLRNQEKNTETGFNLCLADFVNNNVNPVLGLWAVTAGYPEKLWYDELINSKNDYKIILFKAICDRIAEAFAEKLHMGVMDEFLNKDFDKHAGFKRKSQGIRPAPGYPCCPDHSEKLKIIKLLKADNAGISITENYGLIPASSICGYYFTSPASRYFSVGKIGKDQVQDYAERKGKEITEIEKLLTNYLNYKI